MKKLIVLITGCTGFIGSNLALRLSKYTDDLILVDTEHNFDNENWIELSKLQYSIISNDFYKTSLNVVRPDIIIHLGANSSTSASASDTTQDLEVYKNILNYCIKSKIRLIFASSAAIYNKSFKEDDIISHNLSDYASNKLNCESFNHDETAQYAALRFFNVWGQGEGHKAKAGMTSPIYRSHFNILEGKKVNLFKETAARDFIYIDDVINIICKFIENPNLSGVFNVGTGIPISFETFIRDYATVNNLNFDFNLIEKPSHLKHYQVFTRADTSKLLDAIGPYSFLNRKDCMKKYFNFLKTHY